MLFSREKWTNLVQSMKKFKSFLIVINSFMVINQSFFYFMEKSSAANKKLKNIYFKKTSRIFLSHGLIDKKWFFIFISENNDTWTYFLYCTYSQYQYNDEKFFVNGKYWKCQTLKYCDRWKWYCDTFNPGKTFTTSFS